MTSLCQNKMVYGTPMAAAETVRTRQPRAGARLYAYKCQLCNGYHVTKMKPPPDRIVALTSYTYRGKP